MQLQLGEAQVEVAVDEHNPIYKNNIHICGAS
jgi:hypothetical protein